MKKVTIILIIVSVTTLSGCVFVRPKAHTILTFHSKEDTLQSASLGFRDTTWALVDNILTIVGHGWHPREHETYAFFVNEPYPAFQPRWLLVTQTSSGEYEIILWCLNLPLAIKSKERGILFKGTVQGIEWSQGHDILLLLDELLLSSPDHKMHLVISGRICAKPETQEYVKAQMRIQREEIQNTSRQPTP